MIQDESLKCAEYATGIFTTVKKKNPNTLRITILKSDAVCTVIKPQVAH